MGKMEMAWLGLTGQRGRATSGKEKRDSGKKKVI